MIGWENSWEKPSKKSTGSFQNHKKLNKKICHKLKKRKKKIMKFKQLKIRGRKLKIAKNRRKRKRITKKRSKNHIMMKHSEIKFFFKYVWYILWRSNFCCLGVFDVVYFSLKSFRSPSIGFFSVSSTSSSNVFNLLYNIFDIWICDYFCSLCSFIKSTKFCSIQFSESSATFSIYEIWRGL